MSPRQSPGQPDYPPTVFTLDRFLIRVSLTAIHNVTSVYIDPIDFLHSYSSKLELLDGREEEEGEGEGEGEEEQAPGKTAENLGVRL